MAISLIQNGSSQGSTLALLDPIMAGSHPLAAFMMVILVGIFIDHVYEDLELMYPLVR